MRNSGGNGCSVLKVAPASARDIVWSKDASSSITNGSRRQSQNLSARTKTSARAHGWHCCQHFGEEPSFGDKRRDYAVHMVEAASYFEPQVNVRLAARYIMLPNDGSTNHVVCRSTMSLQLEEFAAIAAAGGKEPVLWHLLDGCNNGGMAVLGGSAQTKSLT